MTGSEELASRSGAEIMMALEPMVLVLLLIGGSPHAKLLHAPPLYTNTE